MKKILLVTIFLNIILTSSVFSQWYAFDFYTTSRFARAIRLGNTYTGVAEGPETMFYNSAGLAGENSYGIVFSSGQGLGFFYNSEDCNAYDLAVMIPVNKIGGTAGLSINYLSFIFDPGTTSETIYSLHYARNLTPNISVGLSLHDYVSSFSDDNAVYTENEEFSKASANAFDLSLSALFKLPTIFSREDILKLGFQFNNVLNTKVKFENIPQEDNKYQLLRTGFSYTYIPAIQKVNQFDLVKIMFAFDADFEGTKYEFYLWQPNYGIELTLFEMLQFSFGRENEIQIKHTYDYSAQKPVNRYGVGINLPIDKLLNENYPLKISINYCESDWQKIDEANVFSLSDYYGKKYSMRTSSFSIGLNYKF